MIKLRNIIDTWNMVQEYDITGYIDQGNTVLIPESEYNRLLPIGIGKEQKIHSKP